ncbi:MAG TPA: folylpolyglutamate synthase/dihydrofolate synthase family protein [Pyrinomonadaceae bacterium]|nr:folylpolyglutamate synthase/dihydrofolate synthase family protein [Pyrinomonadaceae bacterium]
MNFVEANQYLLSLGHETLAIKLGLRNTELLLESLGSPHKSYKSVQIAGTNGKGSTAAMLESICRAAGISVGLYTSPHLVSITERIKIGGIEISQEAFARFASEVRLAAESLLTSENLEALPTFFEHVTAIALLAFREAGVGLAILETGLGGRLDATTAVRASTLAITPISLDHQEYLGETLVEVAAEKADIIRPDSIVVVSPQPDVVRRVIVERCRECGVTPAWTTQDISDPDLNCIRTFRTERDIYEKVRLALRGAHQLTNAATAIGLAEALGSEGFAIGHDAIIEGLATAKHPGRLEAFQTSTGDAEKVLVLLDGAHNPAGAEALRAYLEHNRPLKTTPLTMVFGAMADKQLDEMAATLFPIVGYLVLTQPRNPRSARVEDLRRLAEKYAPEASTDMIPESNSAIECAISSSATDTVICVTGSLYLVGEVREWLEDRYGQTGRFS